MKRRVIVVFDARDGTLGQLAGEVAASARMLAGSEGSITALIAGDEAVAGQAGFPGVERAVAISGGDSGPMPVQVERAVVKLASSLEADAVVIADGPESMGIAPAVAVALEASLATRVTAIADEDGELVVTRSLYSGKVNADYSMPADVAAVITIQASDSFGSMEAAEPLSVETVEASDADYENLGFVEVERTDVDITTADLLVSIGRGIGDEENIEPIRRMAEAMGAELGASRPLVDAGWMPASRQVGQSGTTVKPKVYLALGISGAVQHLAGIRDAGTVIAINTDPEAPMFRRADYGVIADALEIAERLTDIYSS